MDGGDNKRVIVTGGAGFIGSVLVAELNRRGQESILVVDDIDHEEKSHNLVPLRYAGIVGIADFRRRLASGAYSPSEIAAIIHLGACSSTLETDWEYLLDTNVSYSEEIIEWCVRNGVRCIYASSAAVYGDGSEGYVDDHSVFDVLTPLNAYGKSKLMVDQWARDKGFLDSVVGVRYFNVFGPNEWHKGVMRSVVAKKYDDVLRNGEIELFRSYRPEYGDGEQKRDFVYVHDAVRMTLHLLENAEVAGVFNIGSGITSSWNELARAMFAALDKPTAIRYVDMPEEMRERYQYFTQADMSKMHSTGWRGTPTTLDSAVAEYVTEHLIPHRHVSIIEGS